MTSATLALVGVIASAIISAGVAYSTKRLDARSARDSERATPFEQMVDRLTQVEGQVDTLRRQVNVVATDRDALALYLHKLWGWISDGARPPAPPMPHHLEDAFKAAGVPWPEPPDADEHH